MTLTTPNCPVAESLRKMLKTVLWDNEVNKVDLDLVWEPPWDKSMMSEAAKLVKFMTKQIISLSDNAATRE